MSLYRPGGWNGLADVPGLSVGHAEATGRRTGVSVIRCADLTPASVDVRGGGPATRETDLLAPEATVGAVHAVVLSGGSVFGLAAADEVVQALCERGVGLTPAPNTPPVPIVPAACLYDLPMAAPGGWGEEEPPYRRLGLEALDAASEGPARLGAVGAGYGARAGAGPGGWGEASLELGDGITVAAGVAANPVGSPYMSDGRSFWAWPLEREWNGAPEFGGARPGAGVAAAADPFPQDAKFAVDLGGKGDAPSLNTAIAVVACNMDLAPRELRRIAAMAQDGLARAVRPAHTPFDGDTVFALGLGGRSVPDDHRNAAVALVGAAAADCLARALARGVHAARGSS